MTPLYISIEKVVKYDQEGYSHLECPVCDGNNFKVQLCPDKTIQLYCINDNFAFRDINDEKPRADFAVYDYSTVSTVKKQEKRLINLYMKELISFEELTKYRDYGCSGIVEKEQEELSCENSNCEEPRTTTTTVFNGFETKTIGVCAVCEMDLASDL